ncbi:hypothetical protein Ccrd_022745 [Cynara cardunculus var. scolymus]|uniref:C2 domain-containing protein n=1 Tax=Cynara cardunculus var. scolymus TaxID=59895 RepID=A0A103XY43_CYNCS|nr:hypothetical protein Ccrd_022745 [Cynara cardunculus var. scolymus]
MGNCFSGGGHGQFAVGGTSSVPDTHGSNDAVDSFLKSRGFPGPFSQIELSLSASNLRDRDVLSKSDPMAVVYTKGKDGSLQEVGRTEVIQNSLNPQWITKVKITYYFEMVQKLLFHVYDVDTQLHGPEVKTLKLDDQQYLGEGTCTLSQIVADPKRSRTLDLVSIAESTESSSRKLGQLTVHAEEETVSKTTAELIFKCTDLENKDFFSKSDPFLVISKYVESGATVPICRTEVLKNDLKPVWKPLFLNISQVGSKDSPVVIECFNFNSNGKHDLLGKVQKSLAELEKLSSSKQGENLFLPITIGKDPQTKAIQEVGDVLQYYDYDRQFPSWGFGARPIDGPVSHCFNLNGSSTNPMVAGIHGIMTAYERALSNVSLAGPTLFGPVITSAATIASQSLAANEHKYFVLLIITDGVITDLQETKDALVKASDLPLSILIVGVGGEVSVVQSLLAELPSQFLTYMRNRGIQPKPHPPTTL